MIWRCEGKSIYWCNWEKTCLRFVTLLCATHFPLNTSIITTFFGLVIWRREQLVVLASQVSLQTEVVVKSFQQNVANCEFPFGNKVFDKTVDLPKKNNFCRLVPAASAYSRFTRFIFANHTFSSSLSFVANRQQTVKVLSRQT